jgi:hypothetical protein
MKTGSGSLARGARGMAVRGCVSSSTGHPPQTWTPPTLAQGNYIRGNRLPFPSIYSNSSGQNTNTVFLPLHLQQLKRTKYKYSIPPPPTNYFSLSSSAIQATKKKPFAPQHISINNFRCHHQQFKQISTVFF